MKVYLHPPSCVYKSISRDDHQSDLFQNSIDDTSTEMKIYFVLLAVALSSAEPPAPKYLPGEYGLPQAQYGIPSIQKNSHDHEHQYQQFPSEKSIEDKPSSQYGAPTYTPSVKYGVPFVQQTAISPIKYDTPSNYQPSTKYSIPTHIVNPQYGSPSVSTYNAPSTKSMHIPSSQYGTPQPYDSHMVERQYGAPQHTEDLSEPANYSFQYDVKDTELGADFGHEESRHEDQTQGKFSVVLPDGRRQIVEYTADANGFKPKITYEETGNGYGGYNNGYSNGGY